LSPNGFLCFFSLPFQAATVILPHPLDLAQPHLLPVLPPRIKQA